MNNPTIFTLCKALVELVGKEQALADLQLLYKRHPEMFRDKNEVAEVIDKVVREPDIIIDANRDNKPYSVIKAMKKLDSKKMGDVIIKNENGVNEIFHANKKKISEFTRVEKKLKNGDNLIGGGDTQSPRPDENRVRVAGTGQVRSPINDEIIPNSTNQSQTTSNVESKPTIRKNK